MSSIKRILVPVDFSATSRNALRYALQLADAWKASIEVLYVVPPQPEPADFPMISGMATRELAATARTDLKAWAGEALTQLHTAGAIRAAVPVIDSIEIGMPVSTIVQIARRDAIDLVVMGTKGEHSTLRRLLGSVSTGVVRRSTSPVLVVPEEAQFSPLQSVAYASDLQLKDPFEIWRTLRMLRPFRPDLHLVHVKVRGEGRKPLQLDLLREYLADQEASVHSDVTIIEELDLVTGLDAFTHKVPTDLLVLYKPHETFWHSLFLISESRRLVHFTRVPLLILNE